MEPIQPFLSFKLIFNHKNHCILHNFCFVGPKIVKQQMCILPCLKFCLKNSKSGAGGPMVWEGHHIQTNKTGCVSHCGLAINIKKYLKAKEELWKLKYFTMQKYNLPKIL